MASSTSSSRLAAGRRSRWGKVALVSVLVAGLGWWGWSRVEVARLRAALPPGPTLTVGSELAERLAAAEALARTGDLAGVTELARLYWANGYTREAVACYALLEEPPPAAGDFAVVAAWCLDAGRLADEAEQAAEANEEDRATDWMRRALELDATNGALHWRAAVLWERLRRQVDALPEYEKAVELDPSLVPAWVRLITLRKAIGDTGKAFRDLEAALAANSEAPALLMERGRAAAERGQLEKALADFRRVIELRPDLATGHIEAARVLYLLNRPDEGGALLDEAWRIEPENPIVLVMRTAAAIAAGDPVVAQIWWERLAASTAVTSADKGRLAERFEAQFGVAPPSP